MNRLDKFIEITKDSIIDYIKNKYSFDEKLNERLEDLNFFLYKKEFDTRVKRRKEVNIERNIALNKIYKTNINNFNEIQFLN